MTTTYRPTVQAPPLAVGCPSGEHDTAEDCDRNPWCPVDDPACFGNRCTDHDRCGTP